jgi:hypothetical protein
MITLDVLQQRRESLANTLATSGVDLEMLKERVKVIKKEIANIQGAIIEIDHMIESL